MGARSTFEWLRSLGAEPKISVPDSITLTQFSDSVYGVCEPPESQRPSLEIVFFPGLQPEISNRPEVAAWLSRDKSELWLNWLRNDIPDIRILVVSPNPFMKMEESGSTIDYKRMKGSGMGMTMETIGENVLVDLTGQLIHVGKDGCPVILVGHGVGGILAKEVCLQAHRMKSLRSSQHELENVRNFLDNIKGFFFFVVPSAFDHRELPDRAKSKRDSEFSLLRKKRRWKVIALGASRPVSEGKFKGLLVPEANCKGDADLFQTVEDDFFSICRPESTESESYKHLSHFIADLTRLSNRPQVSGTCGTVFLCGNQDAGKTTLRITLSQTSQSLLTSEGSGRQPLPRTRGIEVSYVKIQGVPGGNPLTLALWDLAGQDDYAVLHSAFLPDLYNGPAKSFIIVCKASDSEGIDIPSAHVLYWLKFISSNTLPNVPKEKRRRVFLVLNCFAGDASNSKYNIWKVILGEWQKQFKNHLNLLEIPFILDATSSTDVTPLKTTLAKEVRKMLQRSPMPEDCFTIQERCKNWAKDHLEYPVLNWKDFSCQVNGDFKESPRLLEQATEYLHGAGHLILLKHLRAPSTPDHAAHKDLVILDPEWFCRRVVGYVLLPKSMVQHGEKTLRVFMKADGSLPIFTLRKSNLSKHIPEGKFEEALDLLSRLGLCYTLDSRDHDRFFIPALIEDKDPRSSSSWFSKGDPEAPQQAWVMGFSLVLKDSSTTLLPIAPLRRLQVDLAERSDIGGRADCEYRAWKSCITFKFEGMDVLVQYIGHDPNTSTQNRLDILIKPLTHESDLSSQKKRQIKFAQEIVDVFLNITNTSLLGVELERRVIKPWSVRDPDIDAPARDIKISVAEVTRRLQDYENVNWAVHGVQVTGEELLSEKDLQPLLLSSYRKCAIGVGILEWTRKFEDVQDRCHPRKDLADKECSHNRQFQEPQEVLSLLKQILEGSSVVQEQVIMISQILSPIIQEFHVQTQTSDEIRRNMQTLMIRIQNVETFPVEKGERIVPGLPYVKKTKEGKTKWITDFNRKILENFEKLFQKTYKLHFLCEAPCDGNGPCHEVEGQAGLDVKSLKKWMKKLVPVLQFALPIIVFGLKVAANVVAPGLQQAIPGVPTHFVGPFTPELQALAEVANNFSEGIKRFDSQQGFSIQDYNQLRGEARAAVKELLDDAREKRVYQEQVGLFRVWLTREGDPRGRMVFICKKCLEKYTQPGEARQVD